MSYKIIDRQGTGAKANNIYNTLDEIRDDLRSYHSIDVEGAEKMTLEDLCEIGEWEVEEVKGK